MIRLLIADDEFFVRNGLIRNIKWKELGVDLVEEADDGMNAYEKALEIKPDIIVTDVRMPRMDGIELGFKVREFLPDCKIIFMSAYSDKEYLKSAINLQAISYVEKPINPLEISKAIGSAAALCIEENKRRNSDIIKERNLAESLMILKNNLSLELLHEDLNMDLIRQWLNTAGIDMSLNGSYSVALLRLGSARYGTDEPVPIKPAEVIQCIEEAFVLNRIKCIASNKEKNLIVIIAYSNPSDNRQLNGTILMDTCSAILSSLKNKVHAFISTGMMVNKVEHICKSYQTAAFLSQQLFFKGFGSLSVPEDSFGSVYEISNETINSFSNYLDNGQKDNLVRLVTDLTRNLKQNRGTLVSNIRNIYYKLLLLLKGEAARQKLNQDPGISEGALWEVLSSIETLDEMEEYLISQINSYFSQLEEIDSGSRTVSEIKRFISRNYSDPDLSIKAIGEKMFLSNSYLCVFFKKETGITINQYITEFRIKKAKELLEDRNVKLYDVASSVGYPDQNYFTKIFKKVVNVTPSEYREKCCR